mgnify:CR=1 FL=1
MKRLFLFASLVIITTFGCNKEEAITPSADFTTNIQNNTLSTGEFFTLYLDNVQGEFLVYFKGDSEETIYNPDDPTREGTPFSTDTDSLEVAPYNFAGEYVFTVVASSTGNWAEDYFQDTKSITLTVVEE